MVKSAYIHIPFCKRKCKYCSFVSFTKLEKINDYICALLKEIEKYYGNESLNTLYFGGGTPSLLDIKYVKEIIECFNLNSDTEITFEMNPDDVDIEYLVKLRKIGINRISLGSQTFEDEVLKSIGRRHNSEQIFNAVKLAKEAGFENISLDLIYGLPNANIKKDLDIITRLDVQHISTYGLKIEENSYWGKFPPKNLPDDDMQADMYIEINKYLEKMGYKRYEISNFAKLNYESRHNLNYWNNEEYYGFGVAAHGYINGIRYSNSSSLEEYLKNPLNRAYIQQLTEKEKLEEEIFLGFRKECGINIKHINSKFDIDFDQKYGLQLNKFMPKYIEKTKLGYKLTLEGVLLSNNILSEFL